MRLFNPDIDNSLVRSNSYPWLLEQVEDQFGQEIPYDTDFTLQQDNIGNASLHTGTGFGVLEDSNWGGEREFCAFAAALDTQDEHGNSYEELVFTLIDASTGAVTMYLPDRDQIWGMDPASTDPLDPDDRGSAFQEQTVENIYNEVRNQWDHLEQYIHDQTSYSEQLEQIANEHRYRAPGGSEIIFDTAVTDVAQELSDLYLRSGKEADVMKKMERISQRPEVDYYEELTGPSGQLYKYQPEGEDLEFAAGYLEDEDKLIAFECGDHDSNLMANGTILKEKWHAVRPRYKT